MTIHWVRSVAAPLLLCVFLGFIISCGGDAEEMTCVPGTLQSCPCPGDEDGTQSCTPDGIFDSCQCGGDANHLDPDAGIPDAGEPDAGPGEPDAGPGEPDAGPGEPDAELDADPGEPSDLNECGGEEDLFFDDSPASPTEVCGACEDGVLACDSPSSLRCIQTGEADDCGTCEDEADLLGEACGPCGDGAFECGDDDTVECVGASQANSCGGCELLDEQPGSDCGDDGVWTCDGLDTVVCEEDLQTNICGGTDELEDAPGESCGPCDDGEIICVAPNSTTCVGSTNLNDCDGCGGLAGTPGETCDDDSQWQCDGDDAVECVFMGDTNACGGTAELDYEPNTTCDDCGTWTCDGDNAVICEGTTDTDMDPDNCGSCGNQCTTDQFCDGGSCEPYNACGGTAELDAEPSEECGDCGVWACQGDDALTCEGEVDLQSDPDNCGECDKQCAIDEFCDGGSCQLYNACGGTQELDADPGEECGDCGEWVCTGSNSVSCQGEVDLLNDPDNCGQCGNQCVINAYCDAGTCELYNDCGGTADLPGELGGTCQDCGEWVCDGEDSMTCVGGTDTETDFFNCGECGNTCKDGEYCENWACNVDKVIQVATSSQHTCALRESGEVFCWGQGGGVLSSSITNATAITTGNGHSCALLETGQVLCWGGNFNGQLGNGDSGHGASTADPVMVQNLENVTAIHAGTRHTCAIEDGQAYCWGNNDRGQLGDGTEEDRSVPTAVSSEMPASATDISGGQSHTCAVANQEAYCWGQSNNGQLGMGSTWGSVPTPQKVVGLPSAKTITAGYFHSCATTNGNTAYCWGRNAEGQLGDGGTQSTNTAGPVSNLGTVQKLTTGNTYSTCALRTDDRVYCWGLGRYGILGIGSTENQSLPQLVSTLDEEDENEVVDLNLGDRNNCAVLKNGQVACWGEARYGRLGDNQIGSWPFPRWLPVISPLIPPVTSEYGQCFTNMDSSGNGLVDCEDPDCATDLGQATGDDVASGQLEGFAGHYTQGSCGGSGPEDVYAWTAPDSGTFVFETGGQLETDADVILYLRGSCVADELGCATDGGPDGRPRLEVEVNEGQTYYLIVDSEPSGSTNNNPLDDDGIYTLNINPQN